MRIDGLHNYYEIHSYCKCEGVCIDYFLHEVEKSSKKKRRSILTALLAVLLKKMS